MVSSSQAFIFKSHQENHLLHLKEKGRETKRLDASVGAFPINRFSKFALSQQTLEDPIQTV